MKLHVCDRYITLVFTKVTVINMFITPWGLDLQQSTSSLSNPTSKSNNGASLVLVVRSSLAHTEPTKCGG